MERILRYPGKGRLWPGILLAILAGVVSFEGSAYADVYQGWWTGYAMGNRYGASGALLGLGHFANHHPNDCPEDPAAWWPYDTFIDIAVGIPLKNCVGTTFYFQVFILKDIGDPECRQGSYWVDVYFGRCKKPTDPCSCPGVTTTVCDSSNTVNSCTNATYFGRNWMSYNGPSFCEVWPESCYSCP